MVCLSTVVEENPFSCFAVVASEQWNRYCTYTGDDVCIIP